MPTTGTGHDDISTGEGASQSVGFTSTDWAGDRSREWSAFADELEATLAPVDGVLLPAADLEAGGHVLDVGCGRGVTARAAAAIVGASGIVTGVDISPTLIAEAPANAVPAASAPIDWVTADAATHQAPPAYYDVVVSRFGTLFFDDPVAAFANLRTAVNRSPSRVTRPSSSIR